MSQVADVTHPLDNPAWAALTGPHAIYAIGGSRARRYPGEISPFMALADRTDPQGWSDLAALAGPERLVLLCESDDLEQYLPPGWEVLSHFPGVQLVPSDALITAPDPEAVRLGPDDVDEILDLISRTRPGPFAPRTIELGTYLGLRREGALVAMAGERMHPLGWTEISAVATDPAYRGQGLAARLIRAVAHGIAERGDIPMLHAASFNTNAIRLYETLGFTLRRRPSFWDLRAPVD